MKPRKLITAAAALALAAYLARTGILTAFEWRRENRMRAMSEEPPLGQVMPKLLLQALAEERAFARELGEFAFKFPLELARYLKAESM